MSVDTQKYMIRAIELANKGLGKVSPNPMVGCVIVHNDEIIGEGYHEVYGEGHAEVNAINSVANKSLLSDSELYVTLEPCSHHGKTPPCAELIISHKLKKVIVCNIDPNPKVAGKGVELLRSAGIEVEVGCMSEEGEILNRRFFTRIRKNRPYIILKWAETADGFIARKNYDSKWISDEVSRALVHQWRGEEDAIMVGTNTAKYDDPNLNVRVGSGKDPIRVVIDKKLKLDESLNLFNRKQTTLVYNIIENKIVDENLKYIKLQDGLGFLDELFKDLAKNGIQSIIVEGGSQLFNSIINDNLADEIRVFRANKKFENGINAPKIDEQLFLKKKSEFLANDSLDYFFSRIK